MNAQTEKLFNMTTLMLHFVRSHSDCDIDDVARNHLEACKDAGLVFYYKGERVGSEKTVGFIPIDLEEA